MISPENYYEEYLSGKDAKQIMSIIRGLKNEMGHLKTFKNGFVKTQICLVKINN
jgi:hypothetical protein